MIKTSFVFLFFLDVSLAFPQLSPADRLRTQLSAAKEDTAKVLLFNELSSLYVFSKPDSTFYFANEGIQLARRINYTYGEASNLFKLGIFYRITGYSLQGMQIVNKALRLFKTIDNAEGIILCSNMLAWLAFDQQDYKKALESAFQADHLSEKYNNYVREFSYSTIAECYEKLNQLDSALIYAKKAEAAASDYYWNNIVLGRIHDRRDQDSLSLQYYRKAILQTTYSKDSSDAFIGMANLFKKRGQADSAIYYAKSALGIARQNSFLFEVLAASQILTKIYRTSHLADSTLKYMGITIETKDSLFSQGKVIQFQTLVFNEKLQQQETDADKRHYQTRIRVYILLVVLGFVLFLAIILYRNNKLKQRANTRLQEQKEKIESTLSELRVTQNHLIQKEKMASLGEMTAGIAHEIQNPLNFVNNFSDVNKELLLEMDKEIAQGNFTGVKAIAKDIIGNEEKINHHGRRADAIVKGMLQHSQINTGIKEPTDINKLADEYLRLAYHGLRAKNKSFNVTLKTDYDESIGKISIVPAEMGRVLLNLINNAFYAVGEKSKQAVPGYEPTVTVRTKKMKGHVEIRVEDNGIGIPQKIVDKIFQPFFTTKPTGQGTGLGLSLAYDIVKAHGGELKVETKEGKGTVLIIDMTEV